jgi:hypothetical protein
MPIWYLVMWSLTTPEFEAGQYQTREQCEAAAVVQTVGLRHLYGPHRLHWRCEIRVGNHV